MNEARLDEMDAWQATRWMRFLDWIERHTTGEGSWPWGQIWLKRGFAFHFASGSGGFAISFPLPRWLPGFVKSYQVQELRTRKGRKGSDLHGTISLYPPGWPSAYRTRRLR
jgi:hypothetical protein